MDIFINSVAIFLLLYFVYWLYYYVVPIVHFRILELCALRKKLCLGFMMGDGRITARYINRKGRETLLTRRVDEEVAGRFINVSACETLKALITDLEEDSIYGRNH